MNLPQGRTNPPRHRAFLILLVPLAICVGDIVFRMGGDPMQELGKFNPMVWPTSVLYSIAGWWSLAVALQAVGRRARLVIIAPISILAAFCVTAIWQYCRVMYQGPNAGLLTYAFFEPANTVSLAATAVTPSYIVGWALLSALMFCALYFNKVNVSRRASHAAFLTMIIVSAIVATSEDTNLRLDSIYASDVNTGIIFAHTIRRVGGVGDWGALSQAPRPDVVVVKPEGDIPNILIFIGESLRPTEMSLYGSERPTTPSLEQLRASDPDGFVTFSRAHATASLTNYGILGILSGVYVGHSRQHAETGPLIWQYSDQLGGRSDLVATQMWSWANLSVHYFTEQPPTSWQTADELKLPLANDQGVDDRLSARALVEQMSLAGGASPWLGIYQSNATHIPYLLPESVPWPITDAMDRYQAAMLLVDHTFQILLDGLAQHGLKDDTIIIFTSDHADLRPGIPPDVPPGHEPCIDRVQGGRVASCHPAVTYIPFFVYVPPKWQARLGDKMDVLRANADRIVSNVDIFPTILSAWQQPPNDRLDGLSLFEPIDAERFALCFGVASWATWFPASFSVAMLERYFYFHEFMTVPEVYDPSDPLLMNELRGRPITAADLAPFPNLSTIDPLIADGVRRIEEAQK